jgi:hypothetical protein
VSSGFAPSVQDLHTGIPMERATATNKFQRKLLRDRNILQDASTKTKEDEYDFLSCFRNLLFSKSKNNNKLPMPVKQIICIQVFQ